ncbi:hypothetical protein EMIHUDRAFT_208375 [Emiliania huxleyi CCMP1516]|uniref:C-type lectin domain-containing protein n=2 Tax=Emiliania huxleyi TaxID=2903 RepID=A0A0D3JAG2_EMIH1|nr:hypothetical protein EMIHUDRAFT_208375 [Emiliania huxleyi CCMP1516]EOD20497.1 hypothetical protein EMIHUDRAFT_208375 [Emiliania huxleyi CCMP1516]|eukprot:XP_005772926.1 hypothetical protein EMIHUDRAFT_208375 [Emiliania huxleyi CCMP1516]
MVGSRAAGQRICRQSLFETASPTIMEHGTASEPSLASPRLGYTSATPIARAPTPAAVPFTYHPDPKSWQDAEADCVTRGTHLATICSQADSDAVAALSGSAAVWIGLNDKGTEGTWVWAGGSTCSYRNWASREPNGAWGTNEDAVEVYGFGHSSAGKWNDKSGTANSRAYPSEL